MIAQFETAIRDADLFLLLDRTPALRSSRTGSSLSTLSRVGVGLVIVAGGAASSKKPYYEENSIAPPSSGQASSFSGTPTNLFQSSTAFCWSPVISG
ncbi:hypothetical protein IscW_ISCW009517 [Ixodes scapularis]|uniref:Uncharacterized protein n=1 Tax=Ixodes scapularis TaxID=6945 RepID=B7PXT4_IXOSC|nr:hypothetical protein IscW_ISCW009517 [Ixodes scapularis]|eukprot:XP_002401751.1 hypothetical protein IscW_ISCW009517 [Ixodes scapularis]